MPTDYLTVSEVQSRVEAIRAMADDDESAHEAEDSLRSDVLVAISNGACSDPVACARAALATHDISFARWCAKPPNPGQPEAEWRGVMPYISESQHQELIAEIFRQQQALEEIGRAAMACWHDMQGRLEGVEHKRAHMVLGQIARAAAAALPTAV